MKDKPKAHKWRDGEGVFVRTRLVLEPMPAMEDDRAPAKVRALPWGEIELRDKAAREYWDEPGTLEVNKRTVTEVEANFAKRDTDYFVNLNHNARGKAYGWIEGVDVVEDEGIYLSVDWTSEGADLVRDRAYRYSSIEVILDASAWAVDGSPAVVVAATGLALTNNPAVVEQAPVAYQTLTAALSASDGREIETRQSSLGETEEKGDRMASDFWKKFLSRAAGKDLEDEVDAATEAAKLAEIRKNHDTLTAEKAAATSKATELTEKLEKANEVISEFETANAERIATDQAGQIEAAVTAGKLAPTQSDWAKANFEAFLSLVEGVEDGAVGPPRGRQVTEGALEGTDTTDLGGKGDRAALDTEVRAYLEAHPELDGDYGLAWLAVTKAAEAAAGKGV